MARNNDFRASGSGQIIYKKEVINTSCIEIAFETSKNLSAQCLAFDFVFDSENLPKIVEISYGFAPEAYKLCGGYWDEKNEMA